MAAVTVDGVVDAQQGPSETGVLVACVGIISREEEVFGGGGGGG